MDAAMTERERDPFERELGRFMQPRPAPQDLQRRIADIPRDHPQRRPERRPGPPMQFSWRRWLVGASAPWTASVTAAFASLAVGFWLGFSGVVDVIDTGNDEELVALVFPSAPTMGEEQ
jgi:hypothetical protein